jgi:hypothetical protein
MKKPETRLLDTLLRVREFRAAHAARIPAGSLAGELFDRVATLVDTFEGHAADQASGSRGAQEGSTSKAAAREELIRDLQAISRASRSMAVTVPGMEDRFRSPGSVSDQVLLGVARGFATNALPLKAELIKRGLPTNFLEDLNSDIAAFEQATLRQAQGTETRVAATAGIEDQFDEALSLLRELGPIMVNMFADDPTILAAWTSASHIERPARKAAPAKPPTPAGPGA